MAIDTAACGVMPRRASLCWKDVISADSCWYETIRGSGWKGTMMATSEEDWSNVFARVGAMMEGRMSYTSMLQCIL